MPESFSKLKDIIGNVPFSNITSLYAQIMNDWDNIIGKRFAGKSKVENFVQKDSKLLMFVHVSSSPLVQELTFQKQVLIKKIERIYGLKLDEIIIKVGGKTPQNKQQFKPNVVRETYDVRPTKEELDKIILDEVLVNNVEHSINQQTALSDEQKTRMKEIIFNDLKTQEWMKQKGFPVCKICGMVMIEKDFGDESICKFCKNNFAK